MSLGTEYWQSVTSLKALTATTSLPLLRVALLASNLCCPKQHVQDGVARLYSKKDVSRLQTPKLIGKLSQAERVLGRCWAKALAAELPHTRACRLFGRACSRCISFLLQKRNQEALPESLEAVEASFDADLEARQAKAAATAASSSSANPFARPVTGFVSLDEASDSLFLAQQKLDLTPGRFFLHKDYPDRAWELQYVENDKATLLYTNALGTERSKVEVLLSDDRKVLKLSKSPRLRLLTAEEYRDRRDWKTCAVLGEAPGDSIRPRAGSRGAAGGVPFKAYLRWQRLQERGVGACAQHRLRFQGVAESAQGGHFDQRAASWWLCFLGAAAEGLETGRRRVFPRVQFSVLVSGERDRARADAA